MDCDAQQRALMREGTQHHQRNDFACAEASYRSVLALSPHSGASILLANAMLSRATLQSSPLTLAERQALRSASLPLARSALDNVEGREPAQRVRLLSRFAYYLLAYASLVRVEGCVHGAAAEAVLPPAPQRAALLQEATAALQRVVALDPAYTTAWRNLALALTASARPAEAEAAMASAIASAPQPSWELLYKHGKCLKRLGREEQALGRYCDAVEASAGKEELPLFWLRVAVAEGRERSGAGAAAAAAAPCMARVQALLARFDPSAASASTGLAAPPNAYIRKLFDGYSAHFDEHLVGVLGYKTPDSMLRLALHAMGQQQQQQQPQQPQPQQLLWRQCCDLGCGTGLAGVAFQAHVAAGALDGCDLSPGMVGEARKRGLYRELEAGEVVQWLGSKCAAGVYYDLVLCADVLVYIGRLEPLFEGVAQTLRGAAAEAAGACGEALAAAASPPPCFVFSTEALLGEECPGATFELQSTGRCKHSAAYIRRVSEAAGLAVREHRREAIRENAGVPVLGDLWVLCLSQQ